MNRGTLSEEFYDDIDGKVLQELYKKYQDLLLKKQEKNRRNFIIRKAGA